MREDGLNTRSQSCVSTSENCSIPPAQHVDVVDVGRREQFGAVNFVSGFSQVGGKLGKGSFDGHAAQSASSARASDVPSRPDREIDSGLARHDGQR